MSVATDENIAEILHAARLAAADATDAYLAQHGFDYPCGSAWVEIYGVKGNTKLGRAMLKLGIAKRYGGGLCLYNPSGNVTQSMDAKEAGARAAAAVLQRYGLRAYSATRMD